MYLRKKAALSKARVSVLLLGHPIHGGDADGRENEDAVNDGLPHDAFARDAGPRHADAGRFDEGSEKVDGGNADDGHCQLHLQDTGVHMVQPFRLIRMTLKAKA